MTPVAADRGLAHRFGERFEPPQPSWRSRRGDGSSLKLHSRRKMAKVERVGSVPRSRRLSQFEPCRSGLQPAVRRTGVATICPVLA